MDSCKVASNSNIIDPMITFDAYNFTDSPLNSKKVIPLS
jgi:hypothetical protein